MNKDRPSIDRKSGVKSAQLICCHSETYGVELFFTMEDIPSQQEKAWFD